MSEKEKLQEARVLIESWVSKQSHERCWYYPEIFNKLANIFDIKTDVSKGLPPLEEFKCGCERYQEEEYGFQVKTQITKEKLDKYKALTSNALKVVKSAIIKGQEKQAEEIINMVSNYLSDSKFFEEKNDFINAFAALNYAHGWLDSGVRLGVFNVKDDKLFTVK